MKSSVLLLLMTFVALVSAQCSSHTSCSPCTTAGCGWCMGPGANVCMAGNAGGPSSGTCSRQWVFKTSVSGFEEEGFPINPDSVDVYLHPSVSLQLVFEVTVPLNDDLPLDIMILQDSSASMGDDISTLQALTPEIGNGIKAFQYRTRFGLGSFVDIPASSGSFSNVWRYRPESALRDSFLYVQDALEDLVTTNNYDSPESSMDALMFVAICRGKTGSADSQNRNPGWNAAARRVAMVFTDDYPKCSGTGCSVGQSDNNAQYNDPRRGGGGDPRPSSAIPYAPQNLDCSQVESQRRLHPSRAQVASQLVAQDIIPIFIVGVPNPAPESCGVYSGCSYVCNDCVKGGANTLNPYCHCPTSQPLLRNVYANFVSQVGFGDTQTMDVSSATERALFVQRIITAIQNVASKLQLSVVTDTGSFVLSGPVPVSGCGGYPCSATEYTSVVEGNVYAFTMTLRTTSPVTTSNQYVALRSPGLGDSATAIINVRNYLITCVGCDNVLDSNKIEDACGVCGGDESTCTDCFGAVITDGSPIAQDDECGVCDGDGMSCLGCDNVAYPPPQSPPVVDPCGICGGTSQCLDCNGTPFGTATVDLCGMCGGTNDCLGCDGQPNSGQVVDVCDVCGGNGLVCRDCFNKAPLDPQYGSVFDDCGVCNGTNACLGCDGVANSGKVVDACGVCGGSNQCFGCFGDPRPAEFDLCGVCGGNNTCLGCDGIVNSGLVFDVCGVCGGNNGSCTDCAGDVGGNKTFDRCGQCGGDDACVGCDGVPNSGKAVDVCGVCGGAGGCAGCNGVPNSGLWYDICGVCNGTNACVGCDGVPNSGKIVDACGTCCDPSLPGSCDQCQDCEGTPAGNKVYDICGVCGGNGTCIGCDRVPFSGKVFDRCGICGGSNVCVDCNDIPFGPFRYDICGSCYNASATGNVLTCLDCFKIPFGTNRYDACGVCAGNNATCTGCDGVVYPTGGGSSAPQLDQCGICVVGAYVANSNCTGCDGAVRPGVYPPVGNDTCGVCGGNNACVGCDGIPNSGNMADVCGNCPGDPSACFACNGIPRTLPGGQNIELDACGICGGTASSQSDCQRDPIPPGAIIGASVGGGVAVAAAAVAAFVAYQRWKKGANWLIQDAIEGNQVTGTNPLYEASGREHFNPLYG